MQRDVVRLVSQRLQNRAVPSNPIGAIVTRTAGDELNVPINLAHAFGCFQRKRRILLRTLVSHLPWPIDFVTERPILNLVRLLSSVLPPLIRPESMA